MYDAKHAYLDISGVVMGSQGGTCPGCGLQNEDENRSKFEFMYFYVLMYFLNTI